MKLPSKEIFWQHIAPKYLTIEDLAVIEYSIDNHVDRLHMGLPFPPNSSFSISVDEPQTSSLTSDLSSSSLSISNHYPTVHESIIHDQSSSSESIDSIRTPFPAHSCQPRTRTEDASNTSIPLSVHSATNISSIFRLSPKESPFNQSHSSSPALAYVSPYENLKFQYNSHGKVFQGISCVHLTSAGMAEWCYRRSICLENVQLSYIFEVPEKDSEETDSEGNNTINASQVDHLNETILTNRDHSQSDHTSSSDRSERSDIVSMARDLPFGSPKPSKDSQKQETMTMSGLSDRNKLSNHSLGVKKGLLLSPRRCNESNPSKYGKHMTEHDSKQTKRLQNKENIVNYCNSEASGVSFDPCQQKTSSSCVRSRQSDAMSQNSPPLHESHDIHIYMDEELNFGDIYEMKDIEEVQIPRKRKSSDVIESDDCDVSSHELSASIVYDTSMLSDCPGDQSMSYDESISYLITDPISPIKAWIMSPRKRKKLEMKRLVQIDGYASMRRLNPSTHWEYLKDVKYLQINQSMSNHEEAFVRMISQLTNIVSFAYDYPINDDLLLLCLRQFQSNSAVDDDDDYYGNILTHLSLDISMNSIKALDEMIMKYVPSIVSMVFHNAKPLRNNHLNLISNYWVNLEELYIANSNICDVGLNMLCFARKVVSTPSDIIAPSITTIPSTSGSNTATCAYTYISSTVLIKEPTPLPSSYANNATNSSSKSVFGKATIDTMKSVANNTNYHSQNTVEDIPDSQKFPSYLRCVQLHNCSYVSAAGLAKFIRHMAKNLTELRIVNLEASKDDVA